jgi:hypothetical protein
VSSAAGSVAVGEAARPVARRYARAVRSPWAVAGAVFVVYGLWLAAMFHQGYDARDSIVLGKGYVQLSHISSSIKYDPHFSYPVGGSGYDGQFFYFIAVDPAHARYYMDSPSYRYTKILYPVVARILALGQAGLVPYTLILTNWLAIAGAAGLLAAWLRRKGISPWFAVVYAMCPGTWVSFERDLTEPLSYALVVLAVYLYDFGGRYRYVSSALAFALAILARDKAVIFAGIYGLGMLLHGLDVRRPVEMVRVGIRNAIEAGIFGALALGPYLLWRLFVRHWLHVAGSVSGVNTGSQASPLSGVLTNALSTTTRVMYLFVLFIPAMICIVMGIWALVRRVWAAPVVTLLVLIELSVVSLNADFFVDVYGALRVEAGVILAATFCLPYFGRLTRGNSLWFYASSGGWLLLTMGYVLLAPAWLLGGRA